MDTHVLSELEKFKRRTRLSRIRKSVKLGRRYVAVNVDSNQLEIPAQGNNYSTSDFRSGNRTPQISSGSGQANATFNVNGEMTGLAGSNEVINTSIDVMNGKSSIPAPTVHSSLSQQERVTIQIRPSVHMFEDSFQREVAYRVLKDDFLTFMQQQRSAWLKINKGQIDFYGLPVSDLDFVQEEEDEEEENLQGVPNANEGTLTHKDYHSFVHEQRRKGRDEVWQRNRFTPSSDLNTFSLPVDIPNHMPGSSAPYMNPQKQKICNIKPVGYERTLKREMEDRYQTEDESLSFYLHEIAGYFYRLGISDEIAIINTVCEQMQPRYKQYIRDGKLYQSLQHFKIAVEHADACMRADKNYIPPVPGNSIDSALAYIPLYTPSVVQDITESPNQTSFQQNGVLKNSDFSNYASNNAQSKSPSASFGYNLNIIGHLAREFPKGTTPPVPLNSNSLVSQ